MKLGDTYLLIKGHLWVVASTRASDGSVVMFMLTSRKPHTTDLNCLILAGEHPFVKHDTVVAYELGKIMSVADQQFIIQRPGLVPPQQPVSELLLERIQKGALQSDLTAQKIQTVIEVSMAEQKKARK